MEVVELAGSTGSGKTTLKRALCDPLDHASMDLVDGNRFLGSLLRVPRFLGREGVLANVMLDAQLSPWVKHAKRLHEEFWRTATALIRDHSEGPLDRALRLRALRRQLAAHVLLREYQGASVLVVDEHVMGTIHSTLVYPRGGPSVEDMALFAHQLPLPDLVVHVQAPRDLCVRRTLDRPDPPLRGATRERLEAFAHAAHDAYAQVCAHPRVASRCIRYVPSEGDHPEGLREKIASAAHRKV